MNSARYARPPTTFRAGHVSPRPSPKPARTAAGFVVQFGSHASITTPTVYRNSVIVSGGFQSKELYAFETRTGKPQWAIDLHDDGPSSPACEDNVCVISTESCTLFALAADTGKALWSFWLGDPLTSAPTIAHGRVFASYPAAGTAAGTLPRPPGASHALAAFDLATGKIQWQLWLDSDVMSAPVAMDEFVYVTTFHGTLIKLEQATGKVRYAMRAQATSAPVVKFERGVEQMYYTKRSGAARSTREAIIRADHNEPQTKYETADKPAEYIDPEVQERSTYATTSSSQDAKNGFSNKPAASGYGKAAANVGVSNVSSMQAFQGSRILHLGSRNVNTMGDEVVATDTETGKVLWSVKLAGDRALGGFLGTAPLAARGSVLLGTLDGTVVRLDPASGAKLASYAIGGPVRSQPVVADGWIYVGTEDGRLVAIDTKDPAVTGWPTWGGNPQRTGIAK
jgi:outer membrane protein assembly factor BamB